jgi:hypothetical protein
LAGGRTRESFFAVWRIIERLRTTMGMYVWSKAEREKGFGAWTVAVPVAELGILAMEAQMQEYFPRQIDPFVI